MIKNYLLNIGGKIEITIGKKTLFVIKKNEGNEYTLGIKMSDIPSDLENSESYNKYIEIIKTVDVIRVNDILDRFGIEAKILDSVSNIFLRMDQFGQEHDNEHDYKITLCYENDKLHGAFASQVSSKYKEFGTKFFKEETARKLCNMLNETLSVIKEVK